MTTGWLYSLLYISYLEGTPHLASSLENIFDHVLAPPPHLVTLLQEILTKAQSVDLIRIEGGGLEQRLTALIPLFLGSHHQEIVHAVHEVVHNDPVQPVRVPLESPVN